MIIQRKETKDVRALKSWILVFGRRKTGKTFLVKNFVKWDDYFFVRRDRRIITEEETLNYDAFTAVFKRRLGEKKTIVVDEFHRLPEEFLDFLHFTEKKGKVILISSTLSLAKKFFSAHSPLLGFFAEMPLSIISLGDVLKSLNKKKIKAKEKLELAALLREPITVPFFKGRPVPQTVAEIILFSRKAIPALVGEIFSEEERTLSGVYEGILRAIANGKIVSTEMAGYLFSQKLIAKESASQIQQYLNNLQEFGIIKKILVFNKNKFVYKHISPLTRFFYLADEKYNITEREPSQKEVERIIEKNFPKLVEDNIREFLADKFNLTEAVAEGKDFEVDGLLLKFKKPEIALEVKWKKHLKREDIIKVQKNLEQFKTRRKILFIPDKKRIQHFKEELKGIELMDAGDC